MTWLFLSLACAFFSASVACLSKFLLRRHGELAVMWGMYAFAVPILGLGLFFGPAPQLGAGFWKVVAFLLPLEICAVLLYFKSLKLSPISLVFPFLGLTPVFTILTSDILLGESLTTTGVAGVIIVSAGAYLLNANTIRRGFLAPLKSIAREKGSMLMILVAFIFALTSVLGKRGVMLSSPLYFPGIYHGALFLAITVIALGRRQNIKIVFRKSEIALFVSLGILFAAAIFFHYRAISMIQASYMISVKRLSLVISVIYGAFFFGEKNIGFRLLGAFVMFLGVVTLTLGAG